MRRLTIRGSLFGGQGKAQAQTAAATASEVDTFKSQDSKPLGTPRHEEQKAITVVEVWTPCKANASSDAKAKAWKGNLDHYFTGKVR
jgi:hypothetical protein